VRALATLFARRDIRLQIQLSNSHAPAGDTPRHCEEPPGLTFGEPDDRLCDEAIQNLSADAFWIASLRSQ
jgi:hypothetical protein